MKSARQHWLKASHWCKEEGPKRRVPTSSCELWWSWQSQSGETWREVRLRFIHTSHQPLFSGLFLSALPLWPPPQLNDPSTPPLFQVKKINLNNHLSRTRPKAGWVPRAGNIYLISTNELFLILMMVICDSLLSHITTQTGCASNSHGYWRLLKVGAVSITLLFSDKSVMNDSPDLTDSSACRK